MWLPAMWHFDKCRVRRACASPFIGVETPNDVQSVA